MTTKQQHGFTLIESIAAVVVLAIAVPPMLWSIRSGQNGRVDHVLSSRARWLVTEKLEDIIADRHSSTRGYAYLTASNYPAEATLALWPGFSRSITLNETGPDLASPGSGYMNVTVHVSWRNASGATQTLSLSTVLTEYTP